MDKNETLEQLREVVSSLPENWQKVIVMRYGLDGQEPKSLEEIAAHFGVSRERIRQVEWLALRRLRHPKKIFKEDKEDV